MPTNYGLDGGHRSPNYNRPLVGFELLIRVMRRTYEKVTPTMNCAHVAHQALWVLTMVRIRLNRI